MSREHDVNAETGHIFFRNAVVLRDDGTRHRVLRVDVEDDGEQGVAWLIHLDSTLALPYEVPLEALRSEFREIAPENRTPAPAKSSTNTELAPFARTASPASIRLSQRAYERIEPLVDDPDIFVPSKRNQLLKQRAAEPGSGTPKTLLKDLRNWWQGGQTQDALLGRYAFSGRPDSVGTAGRGSKTADGHKPYQLTQQDLDFMREVIEDYYFDKKVRRTLTATLQHLHETKYVYTDGNGVQCLLPLRESPSYRQLKHFLDKRYPKAEQLSRRKGKKRFAQEDRSTEGSIQLECHGVGHIYEFDATIVDVPLVSSGDRSAIVGKPTLYLIIDRYSRLIVGFYLGFENASYSAAVQAILSIGEDKEELCRKLGIPYDPADWPAHGILPEQFLADQGELMHKKARRIARSMRCTISNVPGLRPDWKPLVECGFMMLHQIIAPDTPAYVPDAEQRKRRAVNRDSEVCQNLHEFLVVIVSAIIAHNKTMQTGYPLSVAQVADGVRPIPRELFVHGIRRRMGQLDRMDLEKVRSELMPRAEATVTEDGIRFENMYYSCPEATSRGWLIEGRRKRKPLTIAFDYRLVDEIIVYAPDGSGQSFVATLTKDSCMFEGWAQADVKRHFAAVAQLTKDAPEVKRQARFEYRSRTKPVIDASQAEMKDAVRGRSRSSRRKDIAAARADELARERESTAGVRSKRAWAGQAAPVTPQAQTHDQPSSNVIPLNRGAAPTANATVEPLPEPADDRPLTLKERIALARRNMRS